MIDARPLNIRLFVEEWEHVLDGEELVGEWAFHIQGCPITLRIKVVRTTNPSDMYIGIANYRIKNHRQNGPYMSIYPKGTSRRPSRTPSKAIFFITTTPTMRAQL